MKHLLLSLSLILSIYTYGQDVDLDSEISKLSPFFQALQDFSKNIPHEITMSLKHTNRNE